MKSEATDSSDRLWAYLHGELAPEERSAFEALLQSDPALRERCERARSLDRLLRVALADGGAGSAGDDDALTERALAAWERDQAAGGSEGVRVGPVRQARVPWFFRRPAFGLAGLAAAAALALLLSPVLTAPRGLTWAEPAYQPLAYRGAAPAASALTTTAADARLCQEELKAALEREWAKRHVAPPRGVRLTLQFQALRDGAFSVCVRARLRDGSLAGEWSGDYSERAAYRGQVEASAASIAEALTRFSGAGGNQP